MKKIVSIFAAAVLAAGFMGCSNDSDNNNAALLLAVSQKSGTSVSGGLPANEGENKLSGNTYKAGATTYKFAASTYDLITVSDVPNGFSLDTSTFKYSENATLTATVTYHYAYGNNTIYSINPSAKYEYKNGDKTYTQTYSLTTYESDADYVKKFVKNQYNEDMYNALGWTKKPTAAQITLLETNAKSSRYSYFGQYGYTDTTSAAEVSADVLAKYNKAVAKRAEISSKVISLNAYKFDGSNLQLASVGNYPKSITLASLYYGIYPFSQTLTSGTIAISGETVLDTENVLCNPQSRPVILITGGGVGYKIKTISDNAAILTAVARSSGSGTVDNPYKWTDGIDVPATFTPSKTDSQISYELKIPGGTLGTVTIPFTSTDSTTTYTTFTKQ